MTSAARVIAPAALPPSLSAPLAGAEVAVPGVVAVLDGVPEVPAAAVEAPVPVDDVLPVRVALAVACNTIMSKCSTCM